MSYGCKNRKEMPTRRVVQDGWFMDGQTRVARMVSIPFNNTRDCRYTLSDLGQVDAGCVGCVHRREGAQ